MKGGPVMVSLRDNGGRPSEFRRSSDRRETDEVVTRKEFDELKATVAFLLAQKLYESQGPSEEASGSSSYQQHSELRPRPQGRRQDLFDPVTPDPVILTTKARISVLEQRGSLAAIGARMLFGLKQLWPAIAAGWLLGLTTLAVLAAAVFSASGLWSATIASFFVAACAFLFSLLLIGARR
jgi:hypothetical protein